MNPDGSDQTRLTNDAGADNAPNWSPDGSKIAFNSNLDGDNEIYVINADGGGLAQLTTNASDDTQAAWQPVPPPGSSPVHVPGRGCGDVKHEHDDVALCKHG